ncbi:mRNA turnover protein 4-like protein [Hypsibius exemplaris]|uniref:Ribosome assembly factor mrt4 n=1 Tax=Hypsibius exemplaris TaxID=2072580 RepID=A0A1W0WM51_HYPEX|nr:mRNA turnover protein 4-like protein [Hypsibius exemplaris]
MPKSKRNREVALTKTKSKGLEQKTALIDEVRKCIDDYKYIYVFEIINSRNQLIKDVREQWKDSKFFFGKNNILELALGKSDADERAPGLSALSEKLRGPRGLLLTNRSKEETTTWFKNHKVGEYARSGFVATESVSLDAGPLAQFSHAIEPHLRQLGLPTTLTKGVVTLVKDYAVCEKGDVLTPEQGRILKLMENPMANFQIKLKFVWTKKTGKVSRIGGKKKISGKATDNEDATMEAVEA